MVASCPIRGSSSFITSRMGASSSTNSTRSLFDADWLNQNLLAACRGLHVPEPPSVDRIANARLARRIEAPPLLDMPLRPDVKGAYVSNRPGIGEQRNRAVFCDSKGWSHHPSK